MRIDKYLSVCGYCSRKEAEKLIKEKRIQVNGVIIKNPGESINELTDTLLADGNKVFYTPFSYYMLNKPKGYVSSRDEHGKNVVLDLFKDARHYNDLFCVGRLDIDTTGLLLITNDGPLCHNLLSPKKHVSKEYLVYGRHELTLKEEESLKQGVDIGEKSITAPALVKRIDKDSFILTISEGKFHQIKRMLVAVGNEVIGLKRLSMGSLKLDENLPEGSFRELTNEEIRNLKGIQNESKS